MTRKFKSIVGLFIFILIANCKNKSALNSYEDNSSQIPPFEPLALKEFESKMIPDSIAKLMIKSWVDTIAKFRMLTV